MAAPDFFCRTLSARRSSGFTLLEISIVLLVLSLMMGGLLAMVAQETRRSKMAELKMKMDAIEYALVSYSKRATTLALPCPANPTLALEHADFGFAVAAGCSSIPSPAYRDGSSAAGTVPVRTLGLPDEYAFDPWGNRFTYAVGLLITSTNALITYPVTSTAASQINFRDTNGVDYDNVVAVVVSHGMNGFGAFSRTGQRKAVSSTNANERLNCGCTSDTANSYSNRYIFGSFTGDASTASARFDDVVRGYQRNFFLLTNDIVIP
ncbi:MAG: prepilin-type N-terminal cleavage/methylation domain-containing protein [Rickettsiales bacterium]|jgi:prepilin-type N-terminal cleavage/methylation domain-containing protein|nr:prepilin-type N-terminal cleavage/methylation domain-containing protein [Rickettsiales bacterium]